MRGNSSGFNRLSAFFAILSRGPSNASRISLLHSYYSKILFLWYSRYSFILSETCFIRIFLSNPNSFKSASVNHRIASKAVMVIKAVNLEGQQEILAVEPMENESEETYSALFRSLQDRGLEKVWLCVSDAHKGLQAAIRNTLPGTTWQRCKVHFMRNILAYVPQKEKEIVAVVIRTSEL